jgi:hypothetical protein
MKDMFSRLGSEKVRCKRQNFEVTISKPEFYLYKENAISPVLYDSIWEDRQNFPYSNADNKTKKTIAITETEFFGIRRSIIW